MYICVFWRRKKDAQIGLTKLQLDQAELCFLYRGFHPHSGQMSGMREENISGLCRINFSRKTL